MSRFSIRNPYFIIVVCLIVAVVGTVSLVRARVRGGLPGVFGLRLYAGRVAVWRGGADLVRSGP